MSHVSAWFSSALLPPLSPICVSRKNFRQQGISLSRNALFSMSWLLDGVEPVFFLIAFWSFFLGLLHSLQLKKRCSTD